MLWLTDKEYKIKHTHTKTQNLSREALFTKIYSLELIAKSVLSGYDLCTSDKDLCSPGERIYCINPANRGIFVDTGISLGTCIWISNRDPKPGFLYTELGLEKGWGSIHSGNNTKSLDDLSIKELIVALDNLELANKMYIEKLVDIEL